MEGQKKWLIRLVAIVWALNLSAGMVPYLDYQPSETVNGIFMVIVGALFIAEKAPKNDEDEDKKELEEKR